jgi:acyl-CoA hydrolase
MRTQTTWSHVQTDCSVVFTDSNTRTTSSFLQDRNVHGKIFGGYIMNKAFEIAYVAAVSTALLLCVPQCDACMLR